MEFKLRPWTIHDLESVAKHGDNFSINRFMSDGFPDSLEKWRTFLEYATTDSSILYLAIEVEGQAVGGIGISPKKDILQKNAELGYWISEEYQGKGIVSTAIVRIVAMVFQTFDIDRIYATPFETNPASRRVLEKAGFVLEARFSKIVIKNGERLDELVYAIRRKQA